MPSPPSDRYRKDIDGLRAVAVWLVVCFHYFSDYWPGGFVGVDIFFVISGFLITGIVVRELEAEKFSLLTFYVRRVRRIFPALIVVLCATLTLGWLWMLPSAYEALSADVFASAAFAANIALWLKSGYFDVESAKKPLLHLWSLGIEEQFYLFWPLLLMAAQRLRLNLLAVALGIAALSFGLNVAMIGKDPVATFYLPVTRAWELLAGGALAMSWNRISQGELASNMRAAAGAILIAVSVLVLNEASAFPGWWALLPVVGSALMLSAPGAWGCRHILSSRIFVWFGQISYPLYLWHWPLLVFLTLLKFNKLTSVERPLVVLLSILLAWLTYRFIEVPIRFGAPRRVKALGLCGAMVLVAIAGVVVFENAGFDFRMPSEIRAMTNVPTEAAKWRTHQCMLELTHDTTYADICVDRTRRPLLMIWGDSTGGSLMPGLLKAQQTHAFGIAQFTASACTPAINVDIPEVRNCAANNAKVLAMARQIKPDIVLLHGIQGKYLDAVADTVATLKRDIGARVVVLGAEPIWDRGLPNEVMRHYMLFHRVIPPRSFEGVLSNWLDQAMLAKLVPAGAEFISAYDVMCNQEGCLTRIGDQTRDVTTSDMIHLTERGSDFLVAAVIDRILDGNAAPTAAAAH
jgi:peptidoglycan/LPS O-acetylase OafA/YrhL